MTGEKYIFAMSLKLDTTFDIISLKADACERNSK
jgi:hypothetical protein